MADIQTNLYVSPHTTVHNKIKEEAVDFHRFFPVEKLSANEKEQVEKLIDFLKNYAPEVKAK
ncbi:MAG: hypothetical protein ABFD14_04075 [Anaerolineaceae bacterium]|jgi:hypothetical protein